MTQKSNQGRQDILSTVPQKIEINIKIALEMINITAFVEIQGGDFKLLSSYIHDIFYFTF